MCGVPSYTVLLVMLQMIVLYFVFLLLCFAQYKNEHLLKIENYEVMLLSTNQSVLILLVTKIINESGGRQIKTSSFTRKDKGIYKRRGPHRLLGSELTSLKHTDITNIVNYYESYHIFLYVCVAIYRRQLIFLSFGY